MENTKAPQNKQARGKMEANPERKEFVEYFKWTDDEMQLLLEVLKDCQSILAQSNLDWIKIRSRHEQIAAKMKDEYPVASLDEYPHKILNFLRCVYYCHLLLPTTTTHTHAPRAKLLSFHFLDQFCAFTRERNDCVPFHFSYHLFYRSTFWNGTMSFEAFPCEHNP